MLTPSDGGSGEGGGDGEVPGTETMALHSVTQRRNGIESWSEITAAKRARRETLGC